MIQVGFIGAGEIAKTHAAALTAVEGAHLAAVIDMVPQRAQEIAEQYGAKMLPGLEELLAFPGLDVVYILTPPEAHTEQIVAAAQAGLPIFCEKPLARTLAAADQAIAAARQAGVPLMTGLSHRYHPLSAQARELLEAGQLGDFVAAWSHRFSHLKILPGSWLSQRQASGGLALQLAMHDLDWESWLGGEVAQVTAQESHTNPQVEIEDNLWALLHFRQGGSGSVGLSWSARHPHWERGVIGSRGNLRILNQRRLVGIMADGRKLDVQLGDNYDWEDVFVRESRDLVERLQRGEPFAIRGEDGRRALELSLAVQRAAQTQQMVRLPFEDNRLEEGYETF